MEARKVTLSAVEAPYAGKCKGKNKAARGSRKSSRIELPRQSLARGLFGVASTKLSDARRLAASEVWDGGILIQFLKERDMRKLCSFVIH